MSELRVSIIIPAYNEAQTLGDLLKQLSNLYPNYEVIVINDGSTDATVSVAKEAGAIVYSHPYNIGNGAAIKSGIRIASGEVLVFMDADGQHIPQDVGRMLRFFPDCDMVVGSRNKGTHASIFRWLGNKILNRLASYVAKFQVEDLTSGFRAVKAEIAQRFLYLLPNTYSYPTTLTLAVLREGRSMIYIPVESAGRKKGKSQIRIMKDGVRFMMIIARICALYSPLRIFLPVSLSLFLLGLLYYGYTFYTMGRFTNMSALLFSTSVIIFMMGLVSEQITQMRFEKSEGDKFR
jgi:glycosyltransferase involved in cell wall biosynthesis